MTETESTYVAAQLMNDDEQRLADSIYQAIQDYSRHDARGQQTAEYRVGLSDLGFCSERTRRMLAQEDPDDTDLLPAFIGTAIGDHAEHAIAKAWPDALIQPLVVCHLEGERLTYDIPGHPDVVDPTGLVLDFKTTRGLEVPRRTGPSRQQQYQRHCYALGAYQSGLFLPHVRLEDVRVANFWLDRAGDDRLPYLQMEPYSPEVVQQAAWWIDEVVYAYGHGQEARKEPPYEMCAKVCGFFATCRLTEPGIVGGLITDPEILAAVDMHQEATELRHRADRLRDQASAALTGVVGSTGEFTVKWTHVGPSHVEFDRQPYERLSIRKVK